MDSHRKYKGNTAERIISEYEGALLRYAGLILGSGSLAQDAVEAAFIMVLKDSDKMMGLSRDQLLAELYRTVHHVAVTIAGRQQLCSTGTDVMAAVRKLEPAEQQVIILKILEGKSNAEISSIVGLSEERVARLLYKSVMNVTGKLKKAGLL